MSASNSGGLGDFDLGEARALVGEQFVRGNDEGPDVILHLVEARSTHPDAADPPPRPFSLLFRGPLDPVLTQGMHDLRNSRRPLSGLFLVRVQGAASAAWYEAVFS